MISDTIRICSNDFGFKAAFIGVHYDQSSRCTSNLFPQRQSHLFERLSFHFPQRNILFRIIDFFQFSEVPLFKFNFVLFSFLVTCFH
jgi:hypothetical protein